MNYIVPENHLKEIILSIVKETITDINSTPTPPPLPQLRIIGKKVECNGVQVDLSESLKIYTAFEAFIRFPTKEFTKNDLLFLLYKEEYKKAGSSRKTSSLSHSCIKLLSRARTVAVQNFDVVTDHKFAWFYFDSLKKTWTLVRPK